MVACRGESRLPPSGGSLRGLSLPVCGVDGRHDGRPDRVPSPNHTQLAAVQRDEILDGTPRGAGLQRGSEFEVAARAGQGHPGYDRPEQRLYIRI